MLGENIKHEGGRPKLSTDTTVKLSDIGISRDESSKWQTIATLPEGVKSFLIHFDIFILA